MSIEVRCGCGRAFTVPDEFAGKRGKCSQCGAVIAIPGGQAVPKKPHARFALQDDPPAPTDEEIPVEAISPPPVAPKFEPPPSARLQDYAQEEPPPKPAERLLMFIGEWMPGLLMPKVLVLSIVAVAVGFGIMGMGLFVFGLGAALTGIAIIAAGLIAYAQAVAWMLTGQLVLLNEALTELRGNQWFLFFACVLGVPGSGIWFAFRLMSAARPAP